MNMPMMMARKGWRKMSNPAALLWRPSHPIPTAIPVASYIQQGQGEFGGCPFTWEGMAMQPC